MSALVRPYKIYKDGYGCRKTGLRHFLWWPQVRRRLTGICRRRPARAATPPHQRRGPGPDSPGRCCAGRPRASSVLLPTHWRRQAPGDVYEASLFNDMGGGDDCQSGVRRVRIEDAVLCQLQTALDIAASALLRHKLEHAHTPLAHAWHILLSHAHLLPATPSQVRLPSPPAPVLAWPRTLRRSSATRP